MRIKKSLAAALLAWGLNLGALLIPAVFWEGGVMGGENAYFIPQYLDDRTVLQKVFDPRANDNGTYQARELSYFIDYLDANFYHALSRFGIAFFVPLSALVASFLLVLVYRIGVKKTMPHVDPLTAAVSLMPFLTSFVFVSTMGMFYRSGKPLIAPTLLCLMFYVLRVDRERAAGDEFSRTPAVFTKEGIVVFGLCLMMSLLDRQGFFYTLASCAVLSLHLILRRRLKDLLAGALAAAGLAHVYNLYIGPRIIHAVNGYWPSFEYQKIDYGRLLTEPLLYLKASEILADNLVAMFGGFHRGVYAILGLILIVYALAGRSQARPIRSDGGPNRPVKFTAAGLSSHRLAPLLLYPLVVFGLHLLMFSAMIVRHRYVYDYIDHRYWYHPLLFLVVVLFGLALLLNGLLPKLGPGQRRAVCALLLALAASNLWNLRYYKGVMRSPDWFEPYVYSQSEMFKKAISSGVVEPAL